MEWLVQQWWFPLACLAAAVALMLFVSEWLWPAPTERRDTTPLPAEPEPPQIIEDEPQPVMEGHTCYDDLWYREWLATGQVYQKIASRMCQRCNGTYYWLVWLAYKDLEPCCDRWDDLVAFDFDPPEWFVFTTDRLVLRVIPHEERPGPDRTDVAGGGTSSLDGGASPQIGVGQAPAG